MDIFVGNLPFAATEADVRKIFEGFGSVSSVVIVMEKKKLKSRGFGFVQMPDDQQAQAALAALAGSEFMGRSLNVSPARSKPGVARDSDESKDRRGEIKSAVQKYPQEEVDQKRKWFNPAFGKTGHYKQGRRSRNFMKRRAATGIVEEALPQRKNKENPMRWRKKHKQPKPWQKSKGESKPWEKAKGESKPWRKVEGGSKPWEKAKGESKPWRKVEGGSKPWRKTEGEVKPWRKVEGDTKPWRKTNERPQRARFKNRKKSGGYH